MNQNTKALLKACELAESRAGNKGEWVPSFHLAPVTGWMNDPNGLCEFNGVHHIFFQYSPFDTSHGMNYWGHFSTKNFVDIKYHKPALCSDEQFDCHGVYSGSALCDETGMNIFYTGNVLKSGEKGKEYDYLNTGREHNTVFVNSKDGLTFDGKTVVLKNSDYPKNCTCHVRDPKVWKENGKYYMLLGARRNDDVGEAILYSSENKLDWEYLNTITSNEKMGYMWECPDYFEIDGNKYFSVSPQGIDADGYKYNNTYQSGYFKVTGSIKSNYSLSKFVEYDCGFDFYAPQTYIDSKGRRIMIAWFGLPDDNKPYDDPTKKDGWVHMLTFPRELTVNEKGILCQYPVEELKNLRYYTKKSIIDGYAKLSGLTEFDVKIDIAKQSDFTIRIRKDCILNYDMAKKLCTLSFGKSGEGRTSRSVEMEEIHEVCILCDTSSIEIFLNHGEKVFSSRFYPDKDTTGIIIENINGNLKYSNLRPIRILKAEV